MSSIITEEKAISTKMILSKVGGIGWMIFNNPDRRNAVSLDMWESIPVILADFEADPGIRAIVLAGAGGKAFISGADISEFENQRASREAIERYDDVADLAQKRLQSVSKPTIAMIDGWCIGGGVAVALSCDIRIASDRSRFGVPAARLGLGYRMSGIKKLVDAVGPAYAKEIFFTAKHYSAEQAQAMGLINWAVPADRLEATVDDYCAVIADNAPITMRSVKAIVRELGKMPDSVDAALCDSLVKECFDSEDYVEGRRAFMEKRKPIFQGH